MIHRTMYTLNLFKKRKQNVKKINSGIFIKNVLLSLRLELDYKISKSLL